MLTLYKKSKGIGKGIYPERILAYLFSIAVLISYRWPLSNLVYYDYIFIAVSFVYPHLIFWNYVRHNNSSAYERLTLHIDMVFLAIFIYLIDCQPIVAISFLIVNISTNIGVGGFKFFGTTSIVFIATLGLLAILFGVPSATEPEPTTLLLGATHLLCGTVAYNYVDYQRSLKFIAARQQIKQQNTQIQDALHEKEILLKEIHHRVKNNLQIVYSLLSLQSEHIKDQTVLNALMTGKNRIKSMALVHQELYTSGDLKWIDIADYLPKLVKHLKNSYAQASRPVNINLALDSIQITIDYAINIGLITNELIANAFEHGGSGLTQVNIYGKVLEKEIHLSIEDNGIGMDNFVMQNLSNNNSLGIRLVNDLCLQLKAKITIDNKDGTKIDLRIPIKQ